MGVIGIWESEMQYRVMDTTTGRSEVVNIMCTSDEYRDPVFMQELGHKARESVISGWNQPERQPMDVKLRKDIGSTLKEIHASHLLWAETHHGRYW